MQKRRPFVTTRMAAEMLQVSQRTVQLWVEKGQLEAWKTAGGHRRITLESIDAIRRQNLRELDGGRTAKVLIVEDATLQRNFYRRLVEKMGLPVELHMAEDGFRGLLKIGELKPDLVITDLAMPGMDGFRMIDAIRANPELRSLGIVVVTALSEEHITRHGLDKQHIVLLHKPVRYDEFYEAVKESLSQTGTETELKNPQTSMDTFD